MHSFLLTDDVYSLFHLQHCLQSWCLSLCQPFSIPMLIIVYYNGYNYYIHYYKNVFAHKRYYYAYNSNTSTFSASMFRLYNCACVIKFHLGKWRPIRD